MTITKLFWGCDADGDIRTKAEFTGETDEIVPEIAAILTERKKWLQISRESRRRAKSSSHPYGSLNGNATEMSTNRTNRVFHQSQLSFQPIPLTQSATPKSSSSNPCVSTSGAEIGSSSLEAADSRGSSTNSAATPAKAGSWEAINAAFNSRRDDLPIAPAKSTLGRVQDVPSSVEADTKLIVEELEGSLDQWLTLEFREALIGLYKDCRDDQNQSPSVHTSRILALAVGRLRTAEFVLPEKLTKLLAVKGDPEIGRWLFRLLKDKDYLIAAEPLLQKKNDAQSRTSREQVQSINKLVGLISKKN